MKQNNFKGRLSLLFLFMFPVFLFAQNVITGTVSTANGEVVPFANVIEKGTTNGVTANIDGKYSIEVENLPVVLEYSSLGFTTFQQSVGRAGATNVVLQADAQALEEVVITGLATSVKRSNSANAVASL